jgi:hypothetical protein
MNTVHIFLLFGKVLSKMLVLHLICCNKVGSATINLRSFDDNKIVKRTILCTNSLLSVQKIIKESWLWERSEKKILDSENYLDSE